MGNPVPTGERAAKVLATNLVDRVLPIICYEITDEVVTLPQDGVDVALCTTAAIDTDARASELERELVNAGLPRPKARVTRVSELPPTPRAAS